MDKRLWEDLLAEADTNGDRMVSYDEFKRAMAFLLDKDLKRKRRNTTK